MKELSAMQAIINNAPHLAVSVDEAGIYYSESGARYEFGQFKRCPLARAVGKVTPLSHIRELLKMMIEISEYRAALEKVISDSDIGVVPKSHLNHIQSILNKRESDDEPK